MIYEHATLTITAGRQTEFERAFAEAPAIFAQADGFLGIELRRSVEQTDRYVVMVGWETLEHHTVTFRQGPLFSAWRALVGPFFTEAPLVEHFAAAAVPSDPQDAT